MKSWKKLNLLGLSFLVACSSAPKNAQEVVHEDSHYKLTRTVASLEITKNDFSTEAVQKTLKAIFHSYVLGQTLLHEFDAILDKNPASAMDTEAYAELLAIRMSVDHFEEEINDLYIQLVLVSALSENEEHKQNARKSLNIIGQFMDGIVGSRELNESLQHLVLGNLREKQTLLYEELNARKQLIKDNTPARESIHKDMAYLRATRMKYHKAMKGFEVDPLALEEAVAEMKKDKDFINYRAELKKTSKEIRKLNRSVMRGRSTSSDVIYPNTSSAGNITGNAFPAKTWTITYDDGPSSIHTKAVLKNLQDRKLKATFFMLAKQVEGLPNHAQAVVDAEMDIASHSYDHKQLGKSSTDAVLNKQIGDAKKIIEKSSGKTVKLFRLPYGAGTSAANVRSKIAAHNLIHVFWNVDTLDWQDKNPDSILARTKKQMAASPKNSGIVLFHDIHKQSVIASAMLMDDMIKNDIKVCTVQGIVDQINKGLESCQ